MNLKQLRKQFQIEGKKGVINAYITLNGGKNGVIKKYGSIQAFCNSLKEAGFCRSYINEVSNRLK